MEISGIEAQVAQDIAERQQRGIAKYGTTVADSPRTDHAYWLQHAYEEALDMAIYLKKLLTMKKKRGPSKKRLD